MIQTIFHPASYSSDELALLGALLHFDGPAYLASHPDVAAAGADPLIHYLGWGMHEGRFAWPLALPRASSAPFTPSSLAEIIGFDAEFYARTYPDVADNHLQHFVAAGMAERRLGFNFGDNSETEAIAWQVLARHGLTVEGSLDRQMNLALPAPDAIIGELIQEVRAKRLRPKTYRNNFWIALAAACLAKGYFGAATACYNFFFNYFLPLPALGNTHEMVYAGGRCSRTVAYAQQAGFEVRALATTVDVEVDEPRFLNRPSQPSRPSRHRLPAVHYCRLENVVCVGANSMLQAAAHELLYDYLDEANPGEAERTAEFKGPNLLHAANGNVVLRYIPSELYVDEAFSLMHDHGHNYFHWLIEVLPRYLLARRNGLALDVALLIDEQIGKLQEEVLRLVAGPLARIIKVGRGQAVRVGVLHWVSDLSVNTVHTLHLPERTDILISPTALELLRELGAPFQTHGIVKYERLHIRRRNVEFRRLLNRHVFHTMLGEQGYWGFDPGVAQFEDQVRTFSNARIVVAEAGAALANMVFCQPGAIVCVLVNGYKNSNYFYIVEMAIALGLRVVFFECFRVRHSHQLGVHDDMVVHVSTLRHQLALLEQELAAAATATTPAKTKPTVRNRTAARTAEKVTS